MVVVEGAQALVPLGEPKSEPLCDPLYREVAEPLKFVSVHILLVSP